MAKQQKQEFLNCDLSEVLTRQHVADLIKKLQNDLHHAASLTLQLCERQEEKLAICVSGIVVMVAGAVHYSAGRDPCEEERVEAAQRALAAAFAIYAIAREK